MNKNILVESSYTSINSIDKILKNMMSILSKRIGKVYGPQYPFTLDGKSKFGGRTKGILFIKDESNRFRLNFVNKGDWVLQNVEFWSSMSLKPDFHYKTDGLSTIEILDLITGVFGGNTTKPENNLARFSKQLIKEGYKFSDILVLVNEARLDDTVIKNALNVFLKGSKDSFSSNGDFANEWFEFWNDSKNARALQNSGLGKVTKTSGYGLLAKFKNDIPFSKVTKANISSTIGAKKVSGGALSPDELAELEKFDAMYKDNQLNAKEKLDSITGYADQMMSNEEKHAMIVAGKSGVGKSFGLKKWAKEQSGYTELLHYKSGALTEAAFIQRLYDYRKANLLFFDDCDSIFKLDENIWKAVLATEENRIMSIDKDFSGSPIMRDFIEVQDRGDDKKPLTVKRVVDGENIFVEDIEDKDLRDAVKAFKASKTGGGQILLNTAGDAILISETTLITKFTPKVIMVTNLDMEDKLSKLGLKRRAYYVDLFISNKETADLVKEALPFIQNKKTAGVPTKVKEELLKIIVERFYSSEVLSKAGRVVDFNFSNFLEALEIWISSAPKEIREKMIFSIFATKQ